LTVSARPFVRGTTPVTIDAPAVVGSTTTNIDNGSSLTGWVALTASTTLSVVSGAVRATKTKAVSGSDSVGLRRTGAVEMSTLPYMVIKGAFDVADIIYAIDNLFIVDNGTGDPIPPAGASVNYKTGVFEYIVYRPTGFTAVDVVLAFTDAKTGEWIEINSIDITDDPFGTGKVQTRPVQIYGSQRTELSLSVLGLDAAGTGTVGLGEQILVHTAAARSDGLATFLAMRDAASKPGTSDSTAVSGYYDTLSASEATPYTFSAGLLAPGNYHVVARLRPRATGAGQAVLFRAGVDPTASDMIYDPVVGTKQAPLTVVSSGAVWPQLQTDQWSLIDLGSLRLPPVDIEDPAATITLEFTRGSQAVDLDDVFLVNADLGQSSIVVTATAGASVSAVRLDAASVDAPQASAWVGAANGTMVADATRWVGEQHEALPGELQISTVTPGCATSRVSAHYFPRFHTNVAALPVSP
jgi:hypothetical protein